mmetsp:Transcript_29758/g.28930  ORF Transcript_29758/g.28930 Transcript_29758/m.28930 type:complete len:93 (-) Transcript_29758:938-1216(-)
MVVLAPVSEPALLPSFSVGTESTPAARLRNLLGGVDIPTFPQSFFRGQIIPTNFPFILPVLITLLLHLQDLVVGALDDQETLFGFNLLTSLI